MILTGGNRVNGAMKWVVFVRAVNVGGNQCRPASIAKQLSKFGIINIGAAGTLVVRENISESSLRDALAQKFPPKCDIMICPAADVIKLTSKDPFAAQPSSPNIPRFVSVLAKRLRTPPRLPFCLPSSDNPLVEIIAIRDRFVLGFYRREMKAITALGKLEKILGVAATNRNWNTIERVAKVLRQN